MKSLSVVIAISLLYCGTAFGSGGDRWTLAGDFQNVSNPGPAIDPGAPGGGTGTWTYFGGNGDYTTPNTLPAGANPELPEQGFGWVVPTENHIGLWKFTVDANPKPPIGTGNDTTNYRAGDIGGHGTTGARWKTDHAGEFLVTWSGYNGRNQATDEGQHAGRLTFLRMTTPAGDIDVNPIIGGAQDGSANAYTNSATITLAADDVLSLMNEGGDWVGLGLTITELPIPPGVNGDYNENGVVDAADYVMWRQNAGTNFQLMNEGGVTPGMVTDEDYSFWRSRFGATSGSASVALAAAQLPEPSSLMLGAVMAVLCIPIRAFRDVGSSFAYLLVVA